MKKTKLDQKKQPNNTYKNLPLLNWKYFTGMRDDGDMGKNTLRYPLDLANESWVIAIVGPRGAGKTCFAVWLSAFCMVNYGHPVWSNVNIGFRCKTYYGLTKAYESRPLDMNTVYAMDSELQNGVLLLDEANMFVDTRNSMSMSSRLVNSAIQQTRKRALSIVWTSQSYDWVDLRLKFATDVMIPIRDVAKTSWGLRNGIAKGETFTFSMFDMSGAWTGRSIREWDRPIVRGRIFRGKPCHPIYDTFHVQSIIQANRKVQIEQDPVVIDGQGNVIDEGNGSSNLNWDDIKRQTLQIFQSVDRITSADYFATIGIHGDRNKARIRLFLQNELGIQIVGRQFKMPTLV